MPNQRELDLKYVARTLNDARALLVKASKQAKAMGLNTADMDAATALATIAGNDVKSMIGKPAIKE